MSASWRVVLGLVAVLGCTTAARAQVEDERAGVERALLALDAPRGGAIIWREVGARLGPARVPALIAIAGDPRAARVIRQRALGALVAHPSDATFTLMVRLAGDPAEHALVSRASVQALGASFGARAEATLRAALSDARPEVREAAALAAPHPLPPGLAHALREARAQEPEAYVRLAIERALLAP